MSLLARIWPQLAIAAAILGALWWVDNRGYQRAKDQADLEKLQRVVEAEQLRAEILVDLSAKLAENDKTTHAAIAAVDKDNARHVQPIILNELSHDPSLSDPSRCLSRGLLEAVNAARGHPGAASSAEPVGGNPRAVPGSAAGH